MKSKRFYKLVLIVCLIFIGAFLFFNYNKLPDHVTRADLWRLDRDDKLLGGVILGGLTFIAGFVPGVPVSAVETFVGACMGPFLGVITNWIGCALAQISWLKIIQFLSMKQSPLLYKIEDNNMLERIRKINNPMLGLTLAYVNPIFPPMLVTICLSEQKLSTFKKNLCITLGFVPSAFILSIGGDAIMRGDFKKILMVILIMGLIIFIFEMKNKIDKKTIN